MQGENKKQVIKTMGDEMDAGMSEEEYPLTSRFYPINFDWIKKKFSLVKSRFY